MRKAVFCLLPFVFCAQGCNQSNASSPAEQAGPQESIPVQILNESDYNLYGDQTSKSAIIIRDLQTYEDELAKRSNEYRESVNFDTHTILLVDMGQRSSGGYSIRLESLAAENDYLRAQVVLSVPGQNCGSGAVITNPYKFIAIEATADILVSEELEIHDCSNS